MRPLLVADRDLGLTGITIEERLNRKKQENQALADQLLGSKKRRASAPGPGVSNKKTPADKSLASRIGVVKVSLTEFLFVSLVSRHII
jgi:hypothetical protein